MKFGFLAHPTDLGHRSYVRVMDLAINLTSEMQSGYDRSIWSRRDAIRVANIGPITSRAGAVCEGIFYYLPLTAEEILLDRKRSPQRVLRCVKSLAADGAKLVGLGGATSIIGGQGLETAAASPIAVTSGNSLTAYSAYQALHHLRSEIGIAHFDDWITILGYPGSIALVLAKLLLADGFKLNLVHRRSGNNVDYLLNELREFRQDSIRLLHGADRAYESSHFFIGATSSGDTIDAQKLRPGSIVIDVALPKDLPEKPQRDDILVVDGGTVSAGQGVSFGGPFPFWTLSQQINGCIAETIILALENCEECYSIGGTLDPAKVLEIGRLAEHHGFSCNPLASYGQPVRAWQISELRRFHVTADRENQDQAVISTAESSSQPDSNRSVELFRKHINPVMSDFLNFHHGDHVFVRAEGATLWDAHGNDYLDFVAGYGCLNTGHNHPTVIQSLQKFLQQQLPVFVQYVSVPQTTPLLAERLCSTIGRGMERVFFSNSGAESVEAALKLARAASGRQLIVYTDNSYHGKTLGALSVTGRARHRRGFGPLIGECESVPFGDAEALEATLISQRAAAFIVEPIQGEGGICLPPSGYLKSVQNICNRTGTLLIIDEIQTGLGRTGAMLAIEHEDINPDILCLAKSLSGGLVPIGATLCRREIWDTAYGTAGTFALHTSTFGGNNLAAAIGLAALDVIQDERLAENAKSIGTMLLSQLRAVASKYSFVAEVRGQGLMLGIEFRYPLRRGISDSMKIFASRAPGDWHRLYRFLPDETRASITDVLSQAEQAMEDMFCLRFMSKMGLDHRVLTYMTANNNRVMRIQPPLVISEEHAARFVYAFEQTCTDLSSCLPF